MGSINITLGNLLNKQKLVLGWERKVGETKTFQCKSDNTYTSIETNVKPPKQMVESLLLNSMKQSHIVREKAKHN